MAKTRDPRGRPTTGVAPGEKASSYPRLNVRLPPETLAGLNAAARATGFPQWRVIVEAVKCYFGKGPALTAEQLRIARGILRLE
jgi:hypothetical protein